MEISENKKEIYTVILAIIIMAAAASFKNTSIFYTVLLSFSIIIITNVAVKKIVGYNLEIAIKMKFWTWYQYGFKKNEHFKKALPMAILPLLIALFSKGAFLWLGILEFDAIAKAERASRRHGLYRFTEVTERHMGWIATWAIIANLILGIIGYVAGFEIFARLSFYFAMWSVIPIGRLDGTKIFFASRVVWATIFTIASLLFFLSFALI